MLNQLVWTDLCHVLTSPDLIAQALEHAQGGQWLPQELQARRAPLRKTAATLERHVERLTDAYLAEVVSLQEYRRRREELEGRQETMVALEQQLDGQIAQRRDLAEVAETVDAFCRRVARA